MASHNCYISFSSSIGGFLILGAPYVVLIPLIPIIDCAVLFLLSRPLIKTSLWSYFALTRSVVLLIVVFNFYNYVTYESTIGESSMLNNTATIVLVSLLIVLSALACYKAVRGKWQLYLVLAVVIMSVIATVYLNISYANSQTSHPFDLGAERRDNQTARDFQLLSQDVEFYALDHNNRLPRTLSQTIDQPESLSSEENVINRINRYKYFPTSKKRFKLCATFYTDTTSSENESNGSTKAYRHEQGYQCFEFEVL